MIWKRAIRLNLTRLRVVRFLAVAIATAGTGVPAAALDPDLDIAPHVVDHWGTEEGLPQATVRAIAQDGDGYLWLGTQEGLARFDGVRFDVRDRRRLPE